MAAADQPLQQAAQPRQLGPYWRRLLGKTLPGEFSMQQLNGINRIRAAAGLPPVGGKQGFAPGEAGPEAAAANLADSGATTAAVPHMGGDVIQNLPPQAAALLQRLQPSAPRAQVNAAPIHQAISDIEGDVGGGGHMMVGPEEGMDHQANVRNLIMARMQGVAQHATSNQALQKYLRFGKGAARGQRPILPPRKGALPY